MVYEFLGKILSSMASIDAGSGGEGLACLGKGGDVARGEILRREE